MSQPNTSIWANSFLSRDENYKIKRQMQKKHPDRKEITVFTRESYNTDNRNLMVLGTIITVLAIITLILLNIGSIFVVVAIISDLIFFYRFVFPIFKEYNQLTTFYITESELIAEEITFKKVKTKSWHLVSIKYINLTHTLDKINTNYAVNILTEEDFNQTYYKAHTLISLPKNPSNLAYCEEFMASFKKYGLPVDSTAVTSIGSSKRFKIRKVEDNKTKKVTKIRTIIENEGEIKCFACGNMNPSISSYCMNCGSSL